jgi:hypothetical protein
VTLKPRNVPLLSLALLASIGGVAALYAQLEGGDRGIPPVDSASTLEITGVEVDVTGKTAEEARLNGWKQAQSTGWKMLWAKSTGQPIARAPNLSDAVLNAMVSSIVIENEQIGPTRYIARLGILFDRARAGQLLGTGSAAGRRSAPFLVIPVLQTGAFHQSFETRNEWLRAWNRFRTGGSAIDYVRTSGSGPDPLLLNVGQTRRPGRGWWRMLLDNYGAADVIVPEVHLKRTYPGGPAYGTFTARYGTDNKALGRFTLRAGSGEAIPRMLDEGVRRLDAIYTRALEEGILIPDPSLVVEEPALLNEVAEAIERASAGAAPPPPPRAAQPSTANIPQPVGSATAVTIQVDTPVAAAIGQAELSVSRVPGVTSALTVSRSVGGVSTMRVTFTGDPAALAAALQAQGWSVSGSGASMRISRPAPAAPPAPPPPAPAPGPGGAASPN